MTQPEWMREIMVLAERIFYHRALTSREREKMTIQRSKFATHLTLRPRILVKQQIWDELE